MKRKRVGREYSYTVVYETLPKGMYQATVPILPGLVTFGRNFEEVREMARDAIVCYLEALQQERSLIPSESFLVHEKVTVKV